MIEFADVSLDESAVHEIAIGPVAGGQVFFNRHWGGMTEPTWANVHYPKIDYQDIIYYAAPKSKADAPKSLDEVDPELLKTYEKLGIPLQERELLAGVAVDAVFDSVSVATTFKSKLKDMGIIFGSFPEAV